MKDVLLQVNDLTIALDSGESTRMLVNGLSFELIRGETLALAGESGSGKSLTALSLMGLLPTIKGLSCTGQFRTAWPGCTTCTLPAPEEVWKRIRGRWAGMIFQEPMTSLNPLMRCGQQVEEMIVQHVSVDKTEARNQTLQLFQEVQLPDPIQIMQRYPHELSGGQKQRVMIAMALAASPDLLIADEPTTALDVSIQRDIMDLLRSLQQRRQLSILLITHDLALVKQCADTLIVMRQGNLVESGPCQEVLEHPATAYTQTLLQSRPDHRHPRKFLPVMDEQQPSDLQPADKPKTAMPHEVLLRLDQVEVRYPGNRMYGLYKQHSKPVLQHITFDMFKGEALGLVGESGSGKSTLAKVITRLLPSSSGEIYYQGHPISAMKNEEERTYHRRVQIVFQDPYGSLNPRLRIGSCIEEPLLLGGQLNRNQRQEAVVQLLEKVGLSAEQRHRYPHEFSGGQRQRICIARALASNPEMLICDESVSALDVSIQAQILNLLVRLKDELGLTLLFISHDLEVIRHISDRVIVLKDGHIIEINTVSQLFETPQQDYTRTLLKAGCSF